MSNAGGKHGSLKELNRNCAKVKMFLSAFFYNSLQEETFLMGKMDEHFSSNGLLDALKAEF